MNTTTKHPKYRATYSMLRQVFERGVGGYNTNPQSVRPNVTSFRSMGIS